MNLIKCYALHLLAFVFALGMTAAAQAAETITFFHNDISGTPMVATDASGKLLWKENFRPYGEKLNNQTASAGNKLWFAGKSFDADSGLSYMGARYYDPQLGRFTGVDPQDFNPANIHSFNRYAYANNNPYKFVDPDGHSPIDIAFLVYDIGKLGVAIYSGEGIGGALADVGLSVVGVVVPVPGAGQALKAAKAADKGIDAIKAAEHVVDTARGVENATGVVKGTSGGSRAGKPFTQKGKAEIDAENAARNGGVNVCENCRTVVVPAKQSERGVTPPNNERHRDHIHARSKGGDGEPSNGQILCRGCNLDKSDN